MHGFRNRGGGPPRFPHVSVGMHAVLGRVGQALVTPVVVSVVMIAIIGKKNDMSVVLAAAVVLFSIGMSTIVDLVAANVGFVSLKQTLALAYL